MSCICLLFGLSDVSQAGLEPASGDTGALLFSQCNLAQRRAGVSGYESPDSSWCYFSAKCGSNISAKFLIYGAHTACFCILVAILDITDLKFDNIFWLQCKKLNPLELTLSKYI
jgi:hypothetical protein